MQVRHRRGALAAVITTGAVGISAVALAQGGTPPELAFQLGSGAPQALGATSAQPGPTTFTFSTTAKGEHDWALLRIKPGVDVAKVQQDIDRPLNPDQLDELTDTEFSIVTSNEAYKGRPSTTTVDLTPGDYLVADVSTEKRTPSTPLTVGGDPNGATAPTPKATVTLRDYRFSLNRSLPRKGVVRFVNAGKHNHMAIALKVADAAAQRKLVAALKKGKEKAAEKLIRGTGTNLDLVSPGESSDVKASYGKGRYVFVCFFGSKRSKNKPHFLLGMAKPFQVK